MQMETNFAYIDENYKRIVDAMEEAKAKYRKPSDDITLMAVTKTVAPEAVNHAISCGIHTLGENRVQEYLSKKDFYSKDAKVHFIGHLQTNKVKYILDKVEVIHSLDRIFLAQQIDKLVEKAQMAPKKVLVEVNIGNESTKSGVSPDKLSEYLDSLQNFRYIKPIGLMTVAPAWASETELEKYFAHMRLLLEAGKERFGEEFSQLSMGMSHDYEAAVRQGATMIRIGTALFGARNYDI